ncbi:DUF1194 domain-containing protein [Microvirga puerhi]|uniref:DUF1194 domain-containing protein n=1 Tax=Microvirga puerhi TaxID=2876078 RepID=A0ABS7VMD7_9HYPH|nr:DUF1194 domain-containing protein [Microvirga puerhi]MBZ6076691.1 DUF1194 domain-containing protein [Microvirga puerhi]
MVRSGCMRFAAGLVLVLGLLISPLRAQAQTEVDLALVIAVDISFSMDTEEQALQREGFAQAFRSPLVHEAIKAGLLGRIAVTYVEWAGTSDQKVIIPWTVLDNPEGLMAFAERISSTPLSRAQRTSISSALDFSAKLFDELGATPTRQVIDVSGDGPNNQGRAVEQARDDALAKGITINGLPIMLRKPGYLDIADLDIYYRDCVIGGQGSFMVPVREREQFVNAIKTKILLEVANLTPEVPRIERIQNPPRANCLSGEMQWRDRWNN